MNRPIPKSGSLFIPYLDPKVAARETRRFLETGVISLDEQSKAMLLEGTLWQSEHPRSIGRKAHAWFFAQAWYSAGSALSKQEKISLLERIDRAVDIWLGYAQDQTTMAFHDETTAQRVMIFTALLHAYEDSLGDTTREKLLSLLKHDLTLLVSESFHAGLNNHGMFQDIALLVAADYGYADGKKVRYEEIAFTRLYKYFLNSFTQDGIHTENNPTYHVMVARYLAKVVNFADFHGRGEQFRPLKELIKNADRYAAFSVTPLGDFVPISDTNLRRLTPHTAEATFGQGHLLGAVTGGKQGTLPSSNVFVAESSGYGVARSGWTSENDSYLFFNAAYNADYHKHSDELSVFYTTHGYKILTESGPNGYQYDDPFTKYAFSSFAHNSMVVDGLGLPRTDNNSHLTTLKDLGSNSSTLKVIGQTERFTGVKWTREIDFKVGSPGNQDLYIRDRVDSDQTHVYKFFWHIGSEIVPFVRGSFIELYSASTQEKIAEMQWTGSPVSTVRLFHGQRHPRVQGWQFPVMGKRKPTYSVEIEVEGSSIEVDWVIRVDNFVLKDREINPFNTSWDTFEGEKPVHFLLDMPDDGSPIDELAVVFSAVNPIGDFTFNYRASMEKFKGAVLYILDDFGDQGSYYLASGRRLPEFRSVQGLLKNIVNKLGIPLNQVSTFGSSKGGTSALLHGVSLGAGRVFSGAPQYLIGDFLKDPHPNVLEYISGGTDEGDVYWANKIAFDILASGSRSTQLNIVVGLSDGHYSRHVIPLVDDARSLGYDTHLLTIPGIPHSEFGTAFREFIRTWVLTKSTSPSQDFSLPNTVGFDTKTKNFGVCVATPEGATLRGQLLKGADRVGPLVLFKGPNATWKLSEPGSYRVRIYVDLAEGGERKAFGTSVRTVRW